MIESSIAPTDLVIDHVLDTTGLICPEPVMMLHGKVRDMGEGDVVEVIATDPSTQRDIPKFCAFLSHELIGNEAREKKFYYYIRKGGGES
ncbi:sulfurtransferase TusA [Kistimonas asteriae]|uniref:sulfurtransferase TusA n=1 Tax=Kistimonas asteriae TaxID=517724 RepID=UPI001BA4AD80|nr:sulfurtransferase TusA [Kistimonas asteriae]